MYGVAAIFCLYRLAIFRPQPLDAPNTLRPVLYTLYSWYSEFFARYQDAFRIWSAIALLAALIPAILAALFYASRHGLIRLPPLLSSRGLFFTSIAACLILCRFPTLLQDEFNPDEGQFLASAEKLFYDPNFFHSVDCGTSGPINIYPLMLPAIFGISPDFASSRAIVLAIIFLSAFLFYRSIALLAPEEIARIAILPFIAAFAVFKDVELVHYSSEHIPLLLISASLYLSVRVLRDPLPWRGPIVLLGLLTCAAFFAKMQSVPIVMTLAGVAIVYVHATGNAGRLWRPAALFVAGVVPFLLLNTVLCLKAGVWDDFWMSYVRANTSYSDARKSFVENLRGFFQFLVRPNELRFFLLAVFALAIVYLLLQWRRKPSDPAAWFGSLALLFLAASLFSVYKAHHSFIHYLLFLFLPLCTLLAWMLVRHHSRVFVALLLACTATYQIYLWSFQDDRIFKNAAATIRPPEGDYIRSIVAAPARIFVWGWTVRPYLGSGRVPATRDTNVSNCFRAYNLMTSPPIVTPTPASIAVSAYYEKRIAHDLRANPPELFIDAVGPTSWFLTNRKYYGFEQFPDIDGFVKSNYVFLSDSFDQRYYLRRDLVSPGDPRHIPRHISRGPVAPLPVPLYSLRNDQR